MKDKYVILLYLSFRESKFQFLESLLVCFLCFIVSFCLSHFSVGCQSIYWICGLTHCVHSLVTESPWTKCESIHQDQYHLAPTLGNFCEKFSIVKLHNFFHWELLNKMWIDPFVKISILALIWFNSYGLMNQGHFHNFL